MIQICQTRRQRSARPLPRRQGRQGGGDGGHRAGRDQGGREAGASRQGIGTILSRVSDPVFGQIRIQGSVL